MARPVVLVHGAWHGAWAWDRIRPRLDAAGVETIAVDLPGHGADPGPFGDLHADATRVRRTLDEVDDGPVVLVGHSYGGAVITEAGDHPAVDQLVFIAAFALDRDESCMSAAVDAADAAALDHTGRPNLVAGFVAGPDDTVTLDASTATACLFQDCDEEATAWALARLGPQPLLTLQQTPGAVAWRSKPSTYVVCTDDLTVHPDLQRVLARRCDRTLAWPTGHSPFLSRPDLVADLLVDLAG